MSDRYDYVHRLCFAFCTLLGSIISRLYKMHATEIWLGFMEVISGLCAVGFVPVGSAEIKADVLLHLMLY